MLLLSGSVAAVSQTAHV